MSPSRIKNSFVSLKIYDMLGREVSDLVEKEVSPGNYSVRLDGNRLASGIYVYRLNAGEFSAVKKLTLIK